MGESPIVDRSAVANGWTGLNTESILEGTSDCSFTFDMDEDTPGHHPGIDDTFANLDPSLFELWDNMMSWRMAKSRASYTSGHMCRCLQKISGCSVLDT